VVEIDAVHINVGVRLRHSDAPPAGATRHVNDPRWRFGPKRTSTSTIAGSHSVRIRGRPNVTAHTGWPRACAHADRRPARGHLARSEAEGWVRPPPGEPRNALSSWSGDMSSSPQLCSAEGAVDDDFSQSGLEYGEFVIV
jgi:hypothetical protein